MNTIWLCITLLLLITTIVCDQKVDTSHIRVFPAVNKSIAGVFQVSYVNFLNQPQYAFNVSEARSLCMSLGVNIASKADVEEALARGLETCRFGWIDEHFAVIPRRKALSTCGNNQTGLVTWRTSVTKKFDVFCFNESDAAIQLKDTTTDNPLNSRDHSGKTQSPSKTASSTQNAHYTSSSTLPPSSYSILKTMDKDAGSARFVGSVTTSAGAKTILITSTCALLLMAIIVLVYLKMRRSRILSLDKKQQQEHIQTEEGTCVKSVKTTNIAAKEEERIEVDDNSS